MDRRDPLPVRRYVVAGVLAAAAIGGLLLLVRPFIFSFPRPSVTRTTRSAPPRRCAAARRWSRSF